MIKLIVSDVDGTLLPEGTVDMNPELYEVIMKLKEYGITFAAASGRQMQSVKHVFKPVENEIYFISNNGGFVMYQDQVLACRIFSEEQVKKIVKYLRCQENVFYLVTTPEGDYTDCNDAEMLHRLRDGYHIKIDVVEDVLKQTGRIVKVSGYFKKVDAARAAIPAKEKFGKEFLITAAGLHWIDFTAQGSEKGNAVTELQERLGISQEETMAFGDNHNDIGMLERAGESYAVSAAREEVKVVCKYILPDSTNCSVLNVLKALLANLSR